MRTFTRRLMILAAVALTITLVNCRPTDAPPAKVPPSPSPVAAPIVPVEVSPAPTPMPAAGSGIRVTATIGPTCPGPVKAGEEQACTKPLSGEFVVTSQAGKEVARFTTDKDGHATIDLPPGDYLIVPKLDPKTPYPKGGPMSVSVSIGAYTDVAFELDTGIR